MPASGVVVVVFLLLGCSFICIYQGAYVAFPASEGVSSLLTRLLVVYTHQAILVLLRKLTNAPTKLHTGCTTLWALEYVYNLAIITPRRACAARVTVVVLCVCVRVCVCVCHISLMKRLFVLKTLSRTERATKVKIFVGICLKRLRSRVMPRNMSEKANILIIPTYPRSAFSA